MKLPWWLKYAAGMLVALAAGQALILWAWHNHVVMQVLAGATVAALTLGGLWLIAGAADREHERRISSGDS